MPKTNDPDDNGEVKEHRDHWRPREAQSDFLDIGKQAGIEWLSFVQEDQRDYPEYFEGLDRDQKRRLRLAPKESDERVLLHFDLPGGSKLWPVDWYGTELMAVDLPPWSKQISVAIAKVPVGRGSMLEALAKARAASPVKRDFDDGTGGIRTVHMDGDVASVAIPPNGGEQAAYGERTLVGRTGSWRVYVECITGLDMAEAVRTVLNSISIKRELALEGSPKHKVTSTLEEQLGGTLRYPDGVLKLPISDGHLVRKIGGDSTIQIDGKGAEPWILIRRMKTPEGDMRTALRGETTFKRRRSVPSGRFGKGFTPPDAKLPLVAFEYGDSGAENEIVGVLKAGRELLVFEVVSTGLRDGDKRREAKAAALKLLAGATAEDTDSAPEFERLIDWNAAE